MDESDPPTRNQLESALLFIHQMELEGRIEQAEIAADLEAIRSLLIDRGLLSAGELAARRRQLLAEQAQLRASRRFPQFGVPNDKYAIESPEIPCDELVGLCRAACCNLEFDLSIQDLDEGVVRWRYDKPYRIAQDPATQKCAHYDRGCSCYEHRPGPCREFDCRNDERIWKDYEQRIPSEIVSKLAPVPVIPES